MNKSQLLLYRPVLEELCYRKHLLGDSETMSYNAKWGGAVDFPENEWMEWYNRWVLSDESKFYYRYLYSNDSKCFVGEVAYRFDKKYQAHVTNIIIEAKYRGKGYGRTGLALLIDAARSKGIKKLCDDIAADNPSISMFLNAGFNEAWRNDDCVMVELEL